MYSCEPGKVYVYYIFQINITVYINILLYDILDKILEYTTSRALRRSGERYNSVHLIFVFNIVDYTYYPALISV
jgi:hypothetical protein